MPLLTRAVSHGILSGSSITRSKVALLKSGVAVMLSVFFPSSQDPDLYHLIVAITKSVLAPPWPVPPFSKIPGPAQLAQ